MTGFRDVDDTRIRELAETLKKSGMAASETEAIRIATHITGTENRANQNFTEKKEDCTMGLSHLKREAKPQEPVEETTAEDLELDSDVTLEEMQQEVKKTTAEEMIERAQNPQKIEVRTDYETPEKEVMEEEAEEIYQEPELDESLVEQEEPVVEEAVEEPVKEEVTADDNERLGELIKEDIDENTPETTQEIKTKAPKRDLSEFEESKVDLSSVFDFSK
jgi:hypothetical protein